MSPLWLFIFLAMLILAPMAYAGLFFAPWVPTRKKDYARIARLANLQKGETFIDLGSGTAGLLFYLAKETDAQMIGIEYAWPVALIAWLRSSFHRFPNLTLRWGNLFSQDLSQANVIYLFGMPKTLSGRLEQKIWTEAKPGTRLIAYAFQFEGKEPVVVDKPCEKDLAIRVYRVEG